jgi:hypothetical protein
VALNGDKSAYAYENMKTGFAVAAGKQIKAASSLDMVEIYLHGYLVPAS